jgi:photosystem II stability/assembly factor-like uncharacterized protein
MSSQRRKVGVARRAMTIFVTALSCGFSLAIAGTQANHFVDPLVSPAAGTSVPSRAALIAVTYTGNRLVAVGLRGAVVYSDDGGVNWKQAAVPLSSDLVAVSFVSPEEGWVVGHEGVILHTVDGGVHWTKQLDGMQAGKATIDFFRKQADGGDASAKRYVEDGKLGIQDGPSNPFLGVWFQNSREGYAIGSFGAAMVTQDGGKTWRPFNDHIDNPDDLHLFAATGANGIVYVASEKGTIFKKSAGNDRFVPLKTGYKGTFFGVVATAKVVCAFGLRGTIYTSRDGGATWTKVENVSHSTITAGAALPDGRIALVAVGGEVLVSDSEVTKFDVRQIPHAAMFAGVAQAGENSLAVVGPSGASVVPLR